MSSTPFTRKRERFEPAVKNTISLGVLREKHLVTGQVFQTIPFNYVSIPIKSREVTWDSTHQGPPYKDGGDFCTIKIGLDANSVKGGGIYREPTSHSGPVSQKIWEYSGGFCRPALGWESALVPSYMALGTDNPYDSGFVTTLDDLGDEAYDRLRPRVEVGGAAVFLAEARDFPKMLRTSAGLFHQSWKLYGGAGNTPYMAGAKGAADQFLNHHFGWAPFLGDLMKFDKIFQASHEYINRIKRMNGLWVRKERLLDQTSTHELIRSGLDGGIPWRSEFNSMCNVGTDGGGPWTYRYTQRVRTNTRTWATGSFQYYRPEFDATDIDNFMSVWNTVYRHLTVYGLRVNPSVIWKITPWSWLIDWFTNIGKIIDRAVSWASDSVVSRWMFLMKQTTSSLEHSVTVNWKSGPRTMSWSNDISTKQRQGASSSYGFSLANPLTGRQLAILAAIGLSSGRAKGNP